MELKNELHKELTHNILPFWMTKMVDEKNGGFYGRIDGKNLLYEKANKGSVLNMRILWTFSAAYRVLGDVRYLEIAKRAFDYIQKYFLDDVNGGVYWELDYLGNPVNTKKQVYAQGFALYAFSEFFRATQNNKALELAKSFFFLIEDKCSDKTKGGYFEAFTEDWKPIEDMRLSLKDANEKKTMNTHLHILEPYTNLYRIWKDTELKKAQSDLINIFIEKILDKTSFHLNLFFDENWDVKSSIISYGHDIEASWLVSEAISELQEGIIPRNIKDICLKITDAAMEGYQKDGSLIYEKHGDRIDTERHWWVQAEAIVGLMYAYKYSSDRSYKDKAESIWRYIRKNILDKSNGEWFWSVDTNGYVNYAEDKAGFWKCPYHNGRMCLEIIENF